MPELSEFERKLHDEFRACRRCIAALETAPRTGAADEADGAK